MATKIKAGKTDVSIDGRALRVTKQAKGVDVGKALKLRLNNQLSYAQIGELLGASKQMIHQALQPFLGLLDNPEAIQGYRDNKAVLLDSVQLQMITDMIDKEKRQKATLGNAAYAAKQLDDMIRLERGQSTNNISHLDLNSKLEEIARKRETIEAETIEDDAA